MVQDFPRADISGNIIWINMLAPDSEGAARASARIIEDPRVRHFYDPEKRAGKAIAVSMGGEESKVAWDIYLFYQKGIEWIEAAPTPTDWMHQLTGISWADLAHYHTGDELVEELHKAMGNMPRLKAVKIGPPYRRKVELPYCCVPAVLQMAFDRRGMAVPEQEEIGYELGLIVPEEVAHWFRRVRTGSKPPPGGWGTQTGLEEFSIGEYFDRHRLALRIVEHPSPKISDLETFLGLVARHLERGDDVVVCFDRQYLFGTGEREHVALVQADDRRFVVLVDPGEDSPDLCQVPANQLFEALRAQTIGRFGLWVISSRSGSGEWR